jgi:hypothetical protein
MVFRKTIERPSRTFDEDRGLEIGKGTGAFNHGSVFFHKIDDPQSPLSGMFRYERDMISMTDEMRVSLGYGAQISSLHRILILPPINRPRESLKGYSFEETESILKEALEVFFMPTNANLKGKRAVEVTFWSVSADQCSAYITDLGKK